MSKVNVLVVDDAPFIRDLVRKCLRNAFPGMVIEDAVNGRKAMAMLTNQGVISQAQAPVARKVLTAAALTYVVATLAAIWQLAILFMQTRR